MQPLKVTDLESIVFSELDTSKHGFGENMQQEVEQK